MYKLYQWFAFSKAIVQGPKWENNTKSKASCLAEDCLMDFQSAWALKLAKLAVPYDYYFLATVCILTYRLYAFTHFVEHAVPFVAV
jgi:hypothetical protein